MADNKNEIIDPLSGAHIDAAQQKTVGHPFSDNPRMTCRDVDVYYGEKQAIYNVSLDIGKNEVIAMIGPSGCGKSTFLRCLNRMNDTIDICRVAGTIKLDDTDIYDPSIDVVPLRAQVGMVFQKPNPFPKSIFSISASGNWAINGSNNSGFPASSNPVFISDSFSWTMALKSSTEVKGGLWNGLRPSTVRVFAV